MENPIYIGLSRQVALRRQLEVIANNVANMNTAGFRAERTLFEAAMERGGRKPSDQVAFTIDRATYTDMRSGSLAPTNNPYDVALDGDGWLQVRTPDGVRYTRDGRMRRDMDGQLVNASGHPYLDDNQQPIVIPSDRTVVSIGSDGLISADNEMLARLRVARFTNTQALRQTGDVLFAADPGAEPLPAPNTRVIQGKLEQSNVQSIAEVTRMMDLTRDYQAVTRMVDEGQELMRSAINRLGKSS
ncbi:flagellar basal-body rod protein FlgF [Azospirillum thermophilum]|uniref:Flagellar basal-body rod protein FlgF n=1 Tax=Azospirillum thermophilum TaxID=2202148 RepID=A0A2S2CUQ5_9PROT|nr:flagellar basal-body rod protein FlgF [Azospirillum thermophilum]AWK88253.1 flagellar basal-body rod protein FlgF [Azospirillum thermophilum]